MAVLLEGFETLYQLAERPTDLNWSLADGSSFFTFHRSTSHVDAGTYSLKVIRKNEDYISDNFRLDATVAGDYSANSTVTLEVYIEDINPDGYVYLNVNTSDKETQTDTSTPGATGAMTLSVDISAFVGTSFNFQIGYAHGGQPDTAVVIEFYVDSLKVDGTPIETFETYSVYGYGSGVVPVGWIANYGTQDEIYSASTSHVSQGTYSLKAVDSDGTVDHAGIRKEVLTDLTLYDLITLNVYVEDIAADAFVSFTLTNNLKETFIDTTTVGDTGAFSLSLDISAAGLKEFYIDITIDHGGTGGAYEVYYDKMEGRAAFEYFLLEDFEASPMTGLVQDWVDYESNGTTNSVSNDTANETEGTNAWEIDASLSSTTPARAGIQSDFFDLSSCLYKFSLDVKRGGTDNDVDYYLEAGDGTYHARFGIPYYNFVDDRATIELPINQLLVPGVIEDVLESFEVLYPAFTPTEDFEATPMTGVYTWSEYEVGGSSIITSVTRNSTHKTTGTYSWAIAYDFTGVTDGKAGIQIGPIDLSGVGGRIIADIYHPTSGSQIWLEISDGTLSSSGQSSAFFDWDDVWVYLSQARDAGVDLENCYLRFFIEDFSNEASGIFYVDNLRGIEANVPNDLFWFDNGNLANLTSVTRSTDNETEGTYSFRLQADVETGVAAGFLTFQDLTGYAVLKLDVNVVDAGVGGYVQLYSSAGVAETVPGATGISTLEIPLLNYSGGLGFIGIAIYLLSDEGTPDTMDVYVDNLRAVVSEPMDLASVKFRIYAESNYGDDRAPVFSVDNLRGIRVLENSFIPSVIFNANQSIIK